MRHVIASENLIRFSTPYSPALRVDDWLFISGQVAVDKDGNLVGEGDLCKQAEHIFESIGVLLEEAGGSMADLVEVNYYVCEMSRFLELTPIREKYLVEPWPTQTAVGVTGLARPEWLIEISAIARLESD